MKTGLYVCDKCDKVYLVSAVGDCLKADILDKKENVTITFFNSIAEKFIGESANVLKNNKDNTDILYDKSG